MTNDLGNIIVEQLWSWAITAVAFTAIWLAGSDKRIGWLVGLSGQGIYIAFAFAFEQWGFLGHAALFTYVYVRNWLRWGRTHSTCVVCEAKIVNPDDKTCTTTTVANKR